MTPKLFTKSAFKQALTCPTSAYYYRNPQFYANQQLDDEFLESLAEGGFQVGEAAKVYYGIPECDTIGALGYYEALAKTREMFAAPRAKIAEAAFRYGNCFIRADILVKDGHNIQLIEVKAKSWDSECDSFWGNRDPNSVRSDIMPYVYDVTFQKWVVVNALKEQYPGEEFNVKAYLMMADKSKKAPIDGINQMFKIVEENGRKSAKRTSDAFKLAGTDPVVVAFDVDNVCDRILAGDTNEQKVKFGERSFSQFVEEMAEAYCKNERVWAPIGQFCYNCPFKKMPDDNSNLRDGYHECWIHALDWTEEDFKRPLVSDLNGRKDGFFKREQYHLEDIVPDPGYTVNDSCGILSTDRNLLIAGLLTGRKEITNLYGSNLQGDTYLNKDCLRQIMDTWVYPLHMIDFETSAVALPFYKGMRPYESIAFQYSHHIIRKTEDGYTIEHAGQFINVEKGKFPNFDFLRSLKAELEQDEGSIFRYAPHENTILNHIADQLGFSDEPDKWELMEFISTITHPTGYKEGGPRDMIDLLAVVKSCFYHASMKGSNSLKVVLPAVLNNSKFIQDKYSRSIYGSEIKSLNIPASDPVAWITFAEDGKTVINPYKLLPPIAQYMGLSEEEAEAIGMAADSKIANGGAALTAYSELQFSDDVKSEALAKALLRYCELDTMAMVFIWEYFYHEVYSK
jgi:rubrerythrin